MIWDTPDPDEGHLRYSQWRHRCMSSNSKDAYKDLVRAVDNWHVEIFNYFDKRLTNAYTESINSIIRQVERIVNVNIKMYKSDKIKMYNYSKLT